MRCVSGPLLEQCTDVELCTDVQQGRNDAVARWTLCATLKKVIGIRCFLHSSTLRPHPVRHCEVRPVHLFVLYSDQYS